MVTTGYRGSIVFTLITLYYYGMSTYVRAPLGFKEHLAGIADERVRSRKPTLNMGRLAEQVRKSLTPLQQDYVRIFLLPTGGNMGLLAGMNTSLRNAVLVLVAANDLEVLRDFFNKDTDDGKWEREDRERL